MRRVMEGTSAVLLQSGLNESWWADSMECYNPSAKRHRFSIFDGKTPYERRLEQPFEGPIIPFGSLVEYHPISCEGSVANPSIWKESFTWIVPRIRSLTRGEFGRVTYWSQTLRSWRRWTHRKSTQKDSMRKG